MITPKQAADIAAQSPTAAERESSTVAAIEAAIDMRLVLDGRVALACPGEATGGALVTAPVMIMEMERRYRAVGWKTTIHGGTVVIEIPE